MKIEKNIPLPASAGTPKYPWGEMEIGDSILFGLENHSTIRNSARQWGLSRGRKFVTRTTDDGGLRVWRVK